MRLVILFDMLLKPSFKMTTGFANVARTSASTSKFIYQERFQTLRIGSLYPKYFLFLEELKTSLMLTFSLKNSLQSFESLFFLWCERLPIYGNLK